jgi:hypothetical protein
MHVKTKCSNTIFYSTAKLKIMSLPMMKSAWGGIDPVTGPTSIWLELASVHVLRRLEASLKNSGIEH